MHSPAGSERRVRREAQRAAQPPPPELDVGAWRELGLVAGKPKDEEPQETSLIPPSDRAMPWCAGRLAAPLARHHTAKSFRSLSYAMRVAWAFSASRRPWWRRSQRRLAARCEHVEGDQVVHGGSGLSVASLAPPLGARSSTRLAARISHWPASSVSSRSIAVVSYGCWR